MHSHWAALIDIIACRWKLVEIDADLMKLTSEMKHVLSLISPSKSYMVIFEFKLITILFCDAFGVLSFLIIFYTFSRWVAQARS